VQLPHESLAFPHYIDPAHAAYPICLLKKQYTNYSLIDMWQALFDWADFRKSCWLECAFFEVSLDCAK
jgi:hypothetical protein